MISLLLVVHTHQENRRWNKCLVSPRHLEQSCRLLRTQMRLGPDLFKELLRVHFSTVTCQAAFQSIQLIIFLKCLVKL